MNIEILYILVVSVERRGVGSLLGIVVAARVDQILIKDDSFSRRRGNRL